LETPNYHLLANQITDELVKHLLSSAFDFPKRPVIQDD